MNDSYPSNELRTQQNETLTKKEGYEAMLYTLKAYWETSGSNDLTDILSGGEYWPGSNEPVDSAFWEYWTESIEKVKRDGPMFKMLTQINKSTFKDKLMSYVFGIILISLAITVIVGLITIFKWIF